MLGGTINIAQLTSAWAQNLQVGSDLELEAKFGSYTGKRFTSAVPWAAFDRLRRSLRAQSTETMLRFTDYRTDTLRRRNITPASPDEKEIILWQSKDRINIWDSPDYGI